MLQIAVPKSASNALKFSLMYMFDKKQWEVRTGWKRIVPIKGSINKIVEEGNYNYYNYNHLWKHTSGLQNPCTKKLVEGWTSVDSFVSVTLPCEKNIPELIKDKKVVILLRDPIGVVCSIRRSILAKKYPMDLTTMEKFNFKGADTEEKWIKRAEELGFIEDIKRFNKEWENYNEGESLKITFEDVTNNIEGTVRKIMDFWDLPEPTNPIRLLKVNYSRGEDDDLEKYIENVKTKVVHKKGKTLYFSSK